MIGYLKGWFNSPGDYEIMHNFYCEEHGLDPDWFLHALGYNSLEEAEKKYIEDFEKFVKEMVWEDWVALIEVEREMAEKRGEWREPGKGSGKGKKRAVIDLDRGICSKYVDKWFESQSPKEKHYFLKAWGKEIERIKKERGLCCKTAQYKENPIIEPEPFFILPASNFHDCFN